MRRYQQAQLQARIKQLQREQQEQEDEGPVSGHQAMVDREGQAAAVFTPPLEEWPVGA